METKKKEQCTCGGAVVSGHMYGDRFVMGNVDLRLAVEGMEDLLRSFFPGGIPEQGSEAKMCSRCFNIVK